MGLMKNLATEGRSPRTRDFDFLYPGALQVLEAWRRVKPEAAAVLEELRAGGGTPEQAVEWDAWYRKYRAGCRR